MEKQEVEHSIANAHGAADEERGEESVFLVDPHGNHIDTQGNGAEIVENDGDYGVDFNDYADEDDGESGGSDHAGVSVGESDGVESDAERPKQQEGPEHNIATQHGELSDEYEEYEEDYDDDDEDDDSGNDDSGLVVPDVGITRESSLASRITNESGIFSNPRLQSIAFKTPTLQTLSEEMKGSNHESDADFIASTAKNGNVTNSSNTRASSVRIMKDDGPDTKRIADHHDQFVANARYSESIMSYDDNGSTYSRDTFDDNDDAFSFLANDDKHYEIGYESNITHNNNVSNEDSKGNGNVDEDYDDETDTNLTDTESVHTPEVSTFPIKEAESTFSGQAPASAGGAVRNSVFDVHELTNEVDAMRSAFVRSDMHPSVMSKATNIVGPNAKISYDEPLPKIQLEQVDGTVIEPNAANSDLDKDDDVNSAMTDSDVSSSKSTRSSDSIGLQKRSMKSTSTADKSSVLSSGSLSVGDVTSNPKRNSAGSVTITTFAKIPDVDLMKMFMNNKNAEQNIETLRELRNDLNNIDTGLTEWIKFNMGGTGTGTGTGTGVATGLGTNNMLEEDKMGIHVKEALKLLEDGTLHGKNIPLATLSNIGDSLGDTMGNVAQGLQLRGFTMKAKNKKLGERGRTLLRKLRKVPKD